MLYDFTPLYRSFVGFDRMANLIDAASQSLEKGPSYPPYNVAQIGEDAYRIELAVAGFEPEEIDIESRQNILSVTGKKRVSSDSDSLEYLHRGIAERGFERRFQLADHVHVTGADLNNGMLVISLKRELPENLKPRKITIGDYNQNLIHETPSRKAKKA